MNKYIYTFTTLLFLYSCGGSPDTKNTQFYKKQETTSQTLEVSIEASGVIEAISSVEIKSFSLPVKTKPPKDSIALFSTSFSLLSGITYIIFLIFLHFFNLL